MLIIFILFFSPQECKLHKCRGFQLITNMEFFALFIAQCLAHER